MKLKIELSFDIGDHIGMIQKTTDTNNTTKWQLVESPITEIIIKQNLISVKTKDKFYPFDANTLVANTNVMNASETTVITGQPFVINKKIREKITEWINYTNEIANTIIEFDDIIIFHPGYYLNEIIKDMQISIKEFASKAGIPEKTILLLLNAKTDITEEIATHLANYINTSKTIWINLQTTYDKQIQKLPKDRTINNEPKHNW